MQISSLRSSERKPSELRSSWVRGSDLKVEFSAWAKVTTFLMKVKLRRLDGTIAIWLRLSRRRRQSKTRDRMRHLMSWTWFQRGHLHHSKETKRKLRMVLTVASLSRGQRLIAIDRKEQLLHKMSINLSSVEKSQRYHLRSSFTLHHGQYWGKCGIRMRALKKTRLKKASKSIGLLSKSTTMTKTKQMTKILAMTTS